MAKLKNENDEKVIKREKIVINPCSLIDNWGGDGNLNENPRDVEISRCETNGTNDPAELSYYTLGKICTITFHICTK